MEPETDYPSAHSMDTGWFAVDRDGHVAYFDSREAGAVPTEACSEEVTDLLHKLESVVPRTEPVYELGGRSGMREEERHHLYRADDDVVQTVGAVPSSMIIASIGNVRELPIQELRPLPWPTLMFITSIEAVREEIEQGLAIPVPTRDRAAVFFLDLPLSTERKLHQSGVCLACYWNDPKCHDLPERLGLYHYEHPDHLYIPEPYGRLGSPHRPLHVGGLPDSIREMLLRTRFEKVRFEQAGRVQPIEHARCRCWHASGYVGVDGLSIRTIPGEEELYRQEHEQLSKDLGLPAERPSA